MWHSSLEAGNSKATGGDLNPFLRLAGCGAQNMCRLGSTKLFSRIRGGEEHKSFSKSGSGRGTLILLLADVMGQILL